MVGVFGDDREAVGVLCELLVIMKLVVLVVISPFDCKLLLKGFVVLRDVFQDVEVGIGSCGVLGGTEVVVDVRDRSSVWKDDKEGDIGDWVAAVEDDNTAFRIIEGAEARRNLGAFVEQQSPSAQHQLSPLPPLSVPQ